MSAFKMVKLFVLAMVLVSFGGNAFARFMGMDPSPPDPNNIHSFNRYSYANNNPYRYTDPDGRESIAIRQQERMQIQYLRGEVSKEQLYDLYKAQELGAAIGGLPELGFGLVALGRYGLSKLGSAVLENANFAQKTFNTTFGSGGRFAGKTVDDVAGLLRSGQLSPADVPIDYVVREGNALILNTRSAKALEQGGIPRSAWNAIDRTGQDAYEARLTQQLRRNELTSQGTPTAEPN